MNCGLRTVRLSHEHPDKAALIWGWPEHINCRPHRLCYRPLPSLGLPLPYGRRPSASTVIAPLTNLSPAWRAVTIVAITKLLFGLVAETPQLPSSARKAFRQFELGPTAPDLQAPLPTQVASAVKLRPEHEYGSSPPTSSRATAGNLCRRKRGGREIAQSVG